MELNRQIQQRRVTLDDAKKDRMMAVLIRNRTAFLLVQDKLSVQDVSHVSEGHALVWESVLAYYEKYRRLPGQQLLRDELHQSCHENPALLSAEELAAVDTFLAFAFDPREHDLPPATSRQARAVALATCRQFMDECTAIALAGDAYTADGTVPANLADTLERRRLRVELAAALTGPTLGKPFPDGWDRRDAHPLFTCGVPMLDEFMGGGWTGDDVVLFLGPYGSCKTVLACHGAAGSIEYARELFTSGASRRRRKTGLPMRPMVVLFFTEGDVDEYRIRILSNMATVPWTRLAQMRRLADLDDSPTAGATKATAYERQEFPRQEFLSERRRVKKAAVLANQHLLLVDASGAGTSRVGLGGIPDLAAAVRAHFAAHPDTYPLCFCLDHLAAMTDRMAAARGEEGDRMRTSMIRRAVLEARDHLVKTHKAPVLLIHQLTGKSNTKRTVTARFSHADAEGCASLGQYATFAMTNTVPDDKGLTRFECSKHRRAPAKPYKVVEVRGDFNRLVDRTADYYQAPTGDRLLTREQASLSEGFASARPPAPGGRALTPATVDWNS